MLTPAALGRHRLPERQTQHDGKGAEHRVARELPPPQQSRRKSEIEEVRSASGIDSIPCRSNPGGRSRRLPPIRYGYVE